jgi:N-acetylglutamate synthase-like GNAT family acetyltransferase
MLDTVRHATDDDLDRIEALLDELRKLGYLRERKRGYFSWRSRAFMHFHEDSGDIYVDVKLDDKFERMKISSRGEQAVFLAQVRETLSRGR